MPDPTLKDVLDAPTFYGLPRGEQFKALRSFPEFQGLSLKEQGTFLAKAQQQYAGTDKIGEKPKDAGFFSTLGHDIASIPGALTATGTGEPGDTRKPGIIPSIGAAQHAEFEKGRTAPTLVERAGHTLAGAIPVVGPMAAGIGEEIAGGQYSEAGAHAVELAAPAALKEVPVGKLGKAVKAGVKGYREATKGTEAASAEATTVGTGNDTLKTLAERIPKVHPVAKFLATLHLPGAGTVLDVLDQFKKRYGTDLKDVPKETQRELFNRFYKSEHSMEPGAELTPRQELDAIKEARAYLKSKPTATGTGKAPTAPARPKTEAPPPAGTTPAAEGSSYSFTHPEESLTDVRKQLFSNTQQLTIPNDQVRVRFTQLHGHGISQATYEEVQAFNEYIAKNGKLPDVPGVK